MSGLQPFTSYSFFVIPFFKRLDGKPSNLKTIQTLEDGEWNHFLSGLSLEIILSSMFINWNCDRKKDNSFLVIIISRLYPGMHFSKCKKMKDSGILGIWEFWKIGGEKMLVRQRGYHSWYEMIGWCRYHRTIVLLSDPAARKGTTKRVVPIVSGFIVSSFLIMFFDSLRNYVNFWLEKCSYYFVI